MFNFSCLIKAYFCDTQQGLYRSLSISENARRLKDLCTCDELRNDMCLTMPLRICLTFSVRGWKNLHYNLRTSLYGVGVHTPYSVQNGMALSVWYWLNKSTYHECAHTHTIQGRMDLILPLIKYGCIHTHVVQNVRVLTLLLWKHGRVHSHIVQKRLFSEFVVSLFLQVHGRKVWLIDCFKFS